eukprot:scaffold1734_cov113-Isochrysis_galbana.AAC.20
MRKSELLRVGAAESASTPAKGSFGELAADPGELTPSDDIPLCRCRAEHFLDFSAADSKLFKGWTSLDYESARPRPRLTEREELWDPLSPFETRVLSSSAARSSARGGNRKGEPPPK